MNNHKIKLLWIIFLITLVSEFALITFPRHGIEINSAWVSWSCLGLSFAVSITVGIMLFIQHFKKANNLLKKIIAIALLIVASVICLYVMVFQLIGLIIHETRITIGSQKYIAVDRSILFATDVKLYKDRGLIRTYTGLEVNTDDGYNPFLAHDYEIVKVDQNFIIKYHYNDKNSGREIQMIITPENSK